MTPELYWLTATALLTAVLWVPYILKTIEEIGLVTALTEGSGNPPPRAQWAVRLKKAHANAVENLVVFTPLVLALAVSGIQHDLTGTLAMVFFFSRLAHAVIYTLGIPTLRTVAFAVGFGCQVGLALILLGVL